jgi:hypothetical protein
MAFKAGAPAAAPLTAVGVAQGFLIPSIHTVLPQWIPPHDRSRAVSLTSEEEAKTTTN